MPRRRQMLPLRLLAGLALLITLSACTSDTFVTTDRAQELAALPYPADAPYASDRDILVERTDGQIRLINRSPHRLEDMQLWLNREYVSQVDRVAIGTGNIFALDRFINQYQEPFPTAGPLTPDRAQRMLSAELYDPVAEQRYRLVVMPKDRDELGRR